jgi:hypothetical protein
VGKRICFDNQVKPFKVKRSREVMVIPSYLVQPGFLPMLKYFVPYRKYAFMDDQIKVRGHFSIEIFCTKEFRRVEPDPEKNPGAASLSPFLLFCSATI